MTKQELQLKYTKLIEQLTILEINHNVLKEKHAVSTLKLLESEKSIITLNEKIVNTIVNDFRQKSRIEELEQLSYKMEKDFMNKVAQIQQDCNISITHLQSKINKIPKWVFNIWN